MASGVVCAPMENRNNLILAENHSFLQNVYILLDYFIDLMIQLKAEN